MGINLAPIWANYQGIIRPNIRPIPAEHSVSADTNFYCIGRSLFSIQKLLDSWFDDFFSVRVISTVCDGTHWKNEKKLLSMKFSSNRLYLIKTLFSRERFDKMCESKFPKNSKRGNGIFLSYSFNKVSCNHQVFY